MIKEFGLALASAVLIDALVVRCVMLPALLQILGRVTWQIPAWLERILPRITIEGSLGRAPAEPQPVEPRVRREPAEALD